MSTVSALRQGGNEAKGECWDKIRCATHVHSAAKEVKVELHPVGPADTRAYRNSDVATDLRYRVFSVNFIFELVSEVEL